MNVELINPFVLSTINVLKTMCQTNPTAGKPALKQGNRSWGSVSGVIGMAGEDVNGSMVLSFDTPCILSIVGKMLMEEFTEITPDVVDAVGELTNMISGGTKASLNEQGYSFNMASPIVVTGKDVELAQLGKGPVITIPFKTEAGSFVVEASLDKRKK